VLLRLEDVTKVYRNGAITVEVLKGIDLTIEQGEFVSIMGPSGSGKSTLLNIIGCLDLPSSGTYTLQGNDVGALSDRSLAGLRNRMIGFVFQSFHLLQDLSALENVALPLIYRGMAGGERRRRAREALERVGILSRAAHRPSQLSGGEQQRVAIARAIVGQPQLLLADEPTGALDSKNGLAVMGIFQQLNRDTGITIIQVTHDRVVGSCGSRIITMHDGEASETEGDTSA